MNGDVLALGATAVLAAASLLRGRRDRLPGGLADEVDYDTLDPEQLAMGIEVERQHAGDNTALARQIAADHLVEIPDYYTRLARMQADAQRQHGSRSTEPPDLVWRTLDVLGFKVGDYGRDATFVQVDDDAVYQVKLEGWGEECVADCPIADRRALLRRARALARDWRSQGWPRAGVVEIDGDVVAAVTWAVNGPLELVDAHYLADEDIIDLR